MPDKLASKAKEDNGIVLHPHCPVPGASLVENHRCETCTVRMMSICSALEMGELSEIEHLSRPLCYAPRAVLQREGESSDTVYNITGGMVRLSRTLPDGQRQIIGFAVPGDFIGLDLADHVMFSAEAINQVNACRFQRSSFVEFLGNKPALMKRMQALTASELTHAQDHMVVLGRKNADGKVAAFLINLRDRLAKLDHVVAHIPLAMTRQDIADYLGLTIETVSRTLSKFAKQKLIVITPDGVRLLNEEKLRILGEL